MNSPVGKFRTTRSKTVPAIAATAALFVAAVMGLIAFRESVISTLPQLSGVYRAMGISVNLRGLEIINIGSELTEADGIQVLVVRGDITNPGHEQRPVPPVFFALLDEKDQQHYAWSVELDEKLIEPGATIPFRRRLATPPAEARKVMVRFLLPGDPQPAASQQLPASDPAKLP